jgi:exosortase B
MPTVLGERAAPLPRARRASPWLAVLAALALLYVPTYWSLAHGLWRDDEYAHGPIILALFAWLAWRERGAFDARGARPAPVAGGALLALGLAVYAIGRSQSLALFEVGSHLPVIAGVVLLAGGWSALRRFAFPLAFLFFLVPLPGFMLAAATAPLKTLVSACVAGLLSGAGYPVAREGVVLVVGNHPLLIADACSGLNSISALFALALLAAHLSGGVLRLRSLLLLLAVVPVAIAANVLRVLALSLAVFHFGPGAAEGFVHGFTGMVVFTFALGLLFAIERLLAHVLPGRPRAQRRTTPSRRSPSRRAALPAGIAALAIAATALATPALAPEPVTRPLDLDAVLPATFAGWHAAPSSAPIAPTPDAEARLEVLYNQVASRTYVNAAGESMMLMVAYGGDQSDALKAHRQEVCYAAQGFRIEGLAPAELRAAGRAIPATRFVGVRGARVEPVTYWFTMGDEVVRSRLQRLRVQLAAGLAGRIPDGMLVRVSSLSRDTASAYAEQQRFVAALLAAMPAGTAARLAGAQGRA